MRGRGRKRSSSGVETRFNARYLRALLATYPPAFLLLRSFIININWMTQSFCSNYVAPILKRFPAHRGLCAAKSLCWKKIERWTEGKEDEDEDEDEDSEDEDADLAPSLARHEPLIIRLLDWQLIADLVVIVLVIAASSSASSLLSSWLVKVAAKQARLSQPVRKLSHNQVASLLNYMT